MAKDREIYLYTPEGFQTHPGYRDYPNTPFNTVNRTAELLGLYLSSWIPKPYLIREALAGSPWDFVWQAEQGFHLVAHTLNRPGNITGRHLEEILSASRSRLLDPEIEQIEAFGLAVVLFGAMNTHSAREGIFWPPETTLEYLLRIQEMRGELYKVIAGETEPGTPVETGPALWRTRLFFEAGANLPLRHIPQAVDPLERLLADVNLE